MEHPGKILAEKFLAPAGITPYRLAKAIGVQQTRISEIIHAKRGISADTAVRLGAFFGVPAEWFMKMQMKWELCQKQDVAKGIEKMGGRFWVKPSGVVPLEPTARAQSRIFSIKPQLTARLKKQTALRPTRQEHDIEAITYPDGSKAIVSKAPTGKPFDKLDDRGDVKKVGS